MPVPMLKGCSLHTHGSIVIEGSFGNDLTIVNAAKASFARYEESLTEDGENLIDYLLRNKHGSVFEHVVFRFNIKAPIFIVREWMRHRMSSFNEMSGRYVELPPEFYIPTDDYIRTQVGKPGAYTFESASGSTAEEAIDIIDEASTNAWNQYRNMLDMGVAKEIARLVLPVNTYSQFVWTVNLRSLLNFLHLRNSEHAQREIREYAQIIERMAHQVVPVAMQAFERHGRMVP